MSSESNGVRQGDRRVAEGYFQRKPFPKLDGKRRNFPGFRQERTTCIAPHFSEKFQLREICLCVPKEIEADLKNLRSMEEVWNFLVEEYGQPMDLCNDAVLSLTKFKFSGAAKTESQKFVELYRQWNEVYPDPKEINKLSVLEHEPTLWAVVKQLPSTTSRHEYVKLREEKKSSMTRVEHNEPVHDSGEAEAKNISETGGLGEAEARL